MFKTSFLFLLSITGFIVSLQAQDLRIFTVWYYETETKQTHTLVSLSEFYPLSKNPDSLAIPDLSERPIEEAGNFNYIKLDSNYRERFLAGTKISEDDKLHIYDYALDALLTFTVKNLNVIAVLTPYGADWPYTQYDYLIGFEVGKKIPASFDKYCSNSLAYVGRKSPFARGKVRPIIWKKIETKDFPAERLPAYDTAYAGKCFKAGAYKFETKGFQYFVQDMVREADNFLAMKYLVVIDIKTKEKVLEKLLYAGESATFASLNEQWTGILFKNKPPVIFGFSYISFGCPSITFLNKNVTDIYIYCDNRH